MTKIKLASIFSLTLLFSTLSPMAFAENNKTKTLEEKMERRDEKLERRQELLDDKCEKAKGKLEKFLETKKSSHEKRSQALGNIEKGLTNAIKKAKEAGLDTSAVEKDIENLVSLRRKLISLNDASDNGYIMVKSIQCGENKGNIREYFKKAQEEDKAYKKAVKEDLKNTLESLKTNLKSLKEEANKLKSSKVK